MVNLAIETVEKEITNAIKDVNQRFKIGSTVDGDVCPGDSIASQILVTIMGRIGSKLGASIPNNVYIFYDKKSHKQLSIKEAAQKLLNAVTNGK
jgi:hypothetical protein